MEGINYECRADPGKIRRKLLRIHTSAPKVKKYISRQEELLTFSPLVTELAKTNIFQNVVTEPVKSNIFQNVVISPEALKQKLPSYSKKDGANLEIIHTIKSGTYDKDASFPKRRKIPFHEVVSSAKEFLKKREKKKKEAKKDILTNFNALEEALPTLDQLMEKKLKNDAKPRTAKPAHKRDAEMMDDIQTYQQVMNDAQYTVDPIGTITAQLRQRIESGSL